MQVGGQVVETVVQSSTRHDLDPINPGGLG